MYLIPEPKDIELYDETCFLSVSGRITMAGNASSKIYKCAKMLQKMIYMECGFTLPVDRGMKSSDAIWLSLDETKTTDGNVPSKESYQLRIAGDGIRITGAGLPGLFYGIQTFKQILQQTGPAIPCMEINDDPDMSNRGFYHDVTRGRIPTLEYLKKLADRMASYKLNQLHLYVEHSFLFREFSEVWRDDTPLTAEDILELDAYCRERFIDLVPSIASFGHLYKVLRTKSYRHMCEFPDMAEAAFGFVDRMRHHTLDVSNPGSVEFIKRLMDEYMPLFTSKYFNIGADETFDLGKGNSRKLAEEMGTDRLYIDFVKELCAYVVSKGKIPMFWGDIICGFPEAVKELPVQTICLNWGYEPDIGEISTRKLTEAGATIYNCPGICGWDQLVPRIRDSYENIRRMCIYAYKNGAIGILNTDWGDCGHVNHPDFSITGMIYGAAFSWNRKIPEFEDINRQISLLEFTDRSETIVSVLAEIAENCIFTWRDLVDHMEGGSRAGAEGQKADLHRSVLKKPEELACAKRALQHMDDISARLYRIIPSLDSRRKSVIKPYITAIRGMKLMQLTGMVICVREYGADLSFNLNTFELASQLEYWLYDFKSDWRKVSRESELFRIQDVICFYADYLRG